MGTKFARTALLLLAVMFFAALALDIAVPALVLCLMALSNRLLLSIDLTGGQHQRGAA